MPFPFPLQPPPPGNQAAFRFARPGFPWPPSGRGAPSWPMLPPWFPRMPGVVPAGSVPSCQHPAASSLNNSSSVGSFPAVSNAAQNVAPAAAVMNNVNGGVRQRHQGSASPHAPATPPAAPPPSSASRTHRQTDDWSARMYLTVIGITMCILVLIFRRLVMMGL